MDPGGWGPAIVDELQVIVGDGLAMDRTLVFPYNDRNECRSSVGIFHFGMISLPQFSRVKGKHVGLLFCEGEHGV